MQSPDVPCSSLPPSFPLKQHFHKDLHKDVRDQVPLEQTSHLRILVSNSDSLVQELTSVLYYSMSSHMRTLRPLDHCSWLWEWESNFDSERTQGWISIWSALSKPQKLSSDSDQQSTRFDDLASPDEDTVQTVKHSFTWPETILHASSDEQEQKRGRKKKQFQIKKRWDEG
jgi:hypothetical protein